MVRSAWLPVVGRGRITSHEYSLIKIWHEDRVPLDLILKAIRRVEERGATIYSLGVIRADLVQLRRDRAKMEVGKHGGNEALDWRQQWEEDLNAIAALDTNPERRAMFSELVRDLIKLDLSEAQARYSEILSQE
jgi:hypothetical protein